LKKGSPLSPSQEMNLFRAAIQPVSFCIFDYGRSPHISDGQNLQRVGFNSPVADDEPEQFP
jgi:hypothetical protein